MKVILFADSKLIPAVGDKEVHFFNTNSSTITEALNYLESENAETLIVYAELSLNGSKRVESKGIDLVKHIRLTQLKNNLQNIPIILFHWLPIDHYIEHDLENIILYSPGIKRITLPLNTFSFSTPKPLSENITQFLFNSSNDERLSEHAFRNEIAITQFEDDVELGNNSFRNKPIWYKKLFYKHGYTLGNTAESQTPIHQSLKILLIDDMGDKWKPALLNMLPKSEIVVCKSVSDAKQKIKELNDSVVLRRNDFNKKINNLLSSNTEINDKRDEVKTISTNQLNARNVLEASNKILLTETKIVETKIGELHLLLKELTQNNGLLEALIDFKTESINADSKQKANKLSSLIADISNSKDKIAQAQKSVTDNEVKISIIDFKKKKLESELTGLIVNQSIISKDASNLFESLFTSEYDLALLDMHLTKESEGKNIPQMDGFQILETIQNLNLKLPTAIFSATTKQVDQLKNNFKFLQQKQFLKGITPPKDLSLIISDLNTDSVVNRLINIIDEIIAFSPLKYREYESYDSNKYITLNISPQNRTEIVGKISTIKTSVNSYVTNKNVNNLQNIILVLGAILREHRLTVRRSVYDRQNSLFHKTNIEKNRISKQCADLMFWRNKTEHRPTDNREKTMYEEWSRKLDLAEVEKHLKTVYRGLVFDE